MKLTVLGGGGVRSAFLAKSLAYNAHRIGLTEVVFLDSSAENPRYSARLPAMCLMLFARIFTSA